MVACPLLHKHEDSRAFSTCANVEQINVDFILLAQIKYLNRLENN